MPLLDRSKFSNLELLAICFGVDAEHFPDLQYNTGEMTMGTMGQTKQLSLAYKLRLQAETLILASNNYIMLYVGDCNSVSSSTGNKLLEDAGKQMDIALKAVLDTAKEDDFDF